MDTVTALREFGWLGVFILWALDKFFPRFWTFFTDKVFPTRALEREEEARAKREAEASLLKARIEREKRDEERMTKLVERITEAQEVLATNVNQMTLAITVNNERLSQLISATAEHDRFTVSAVGRMNETVVKLHKLDTQPKIRKQGKRGPS